MIGGPFLRGKVSTTHQIQVIIHGTNEAWGGRPVTGVVSSGGGYHGNHYGWSSDMPEDADAPASPYDALALDPAGAPEADDGSGLHGANPYLDHLAMDQADGHHLQPELEVEPPSAGLPDAPIDADGAAAGGAQEEQTLPSSDPVLTASQICHLEPPQQHHTEG